MQRFKSFLLEALEDSGEGTPYSRFSGGKAPEGKELTSRFDFSEYSPVGAVNDIEDMDDYMDKIEKRLKTAKNPAVISRLEAELDKTQGLVDKKIAGLAATSLGIQTAASVVPVAGAVAGRVAGTAMDLYGSFADLRNAYKDAKQAYRGTSRAITKIASGDVSGAKEELKGAAWDVGGVAGRGGAGVVGGALSVLPFTRAGVVGVKTAVDTAVKSSKLGTMSVKAGKAADVASAAAETAAKTARQAEDALNAAKEMKYPDVETYARTMDIRQAEAATTRKAAETAAEQSGKAARVADRTKKAAQEAPSAVDAGIDAVSKELSLGAKGKIGKQLLAVGGRAALGTTKLAGLGLLAASGAIGGAVADAIGDQGRRGSLGGGGAGGGGAGQLYVSSTAGLGGNVRQLTGG
jgi:hypothetical protein